MSNLADKEIDPAAPTPAGVPRTRDPEIGTLPLVFDPEGLSKEIGRLRLYAEPGKLPKVVGIHEMRRNFKPHCTCEIILDTGNGSRRLIGKVYATDRQGVYEYMETLEQGGFHPGAEFSIPHPVAYVPSLRLLLQERVEGTSAQDIFKRGDRRHCAEAAERCARWLARFHATAPPTGRVSGVEKFIRSAERKCRLISEEGGPLAAKCEEVLGRLKAAAPSPGAVSICAGHGDFPTVVSNLIKILLGAKDTILSTGLSATSFHDVIASLQSWSLRPDAAFWFAMCWAEGTCPERTFTA